MSAAEHAIAGTGGGLVAAALLYPLDSIRTRVQVGKARGGDDSVMDLLANPDAVRVLYRGLTASLTAVGISQSIYFFSYHQLRRTVERLRGTPVDNATNLLLAYVAGCVNATLTAPLWQVATLVKLQHSAGAPGSGDPGRKPSVVEVLQQVFEKGGVGGLFKGLPPALVLCVNPAIQFACYEFLKGKALAVLKKSNPSAHLSSAQAFVFGAVAKAVATLLTYPLQVLQTRSQVGDGAPVLALIRTILRESGYAGLFRGLGSKLLQTVLNSAFIFLVYERLLGVVIVAMRALRSRPAVAAALASA